MIEINIKHESFAQKQPLRQSEQSSEYPSDPSHQHQEKTPRMARNGPISKPRALHIVKLIVFAVLSPPA